MSCNCESLSGGITLGCTNNIGGIKEMYITEKCNVSAFALSSPGDEINSITMVGLAKFHKFEFTKNSSFFTENTATDNEKGTELTTQTITLNLNRREKTKRDTLQLLGKFKDLAIIIKDSNDVIWYFGETNGCNMKTREGGSGTSKSDKNGYTIVFVGEEPEEANTVTAAALAAVI